MTDDFDIVALFCEFRDCAHDARKWFMDHNIEEPGWIRQLIDSGYALSEYASKPHASNLDELLMNMECDSTNYPYQLTLPDNE